MKIHRLLPLAILALSLPASAQVKVSVTTRNAGGVAILDSNSKVLAQNFTANQTFTNYGRVFVTSPSGGTNPWYRDYAYTYVYPPRSWGNYIFNYVSISNYGLARLKTVNKGLFTTSGNTGKPGTQLYRMTLTTTKPTNVLLDLWVSGRVYGKGSISTIKMVGPGITRTWNWTGSSYGYKTEQIKLTVNGTVNLDIDVTGFANIGGGSNGGYYYGDGYYGYLRCNVLETGGGSFSLFGTGCGTATLSGNGTPTKGTYYQVDIKGAPAGGPVAFLIGRSKDWFHFIKLPLALDYMGAKGCWLNVSFYYPYARVANARGTASWKLYLSKYYSGSYYIQGVVYDKNANAAGLTLTRGGHLKY